MDNKISEAKIGYYSPLHNESYNTSWEYLLQHLNAQRAMVALPSLINLMAP